VVVFLGNSRAESIVQKVTSENSTTTVELQDEILDNTLQLVTVTKVTDRANASVEDLVEDINLAIAGSSLSGKVIAEGRGLNIILRAVDETIEAFEVTAVSTTYPSGDVATGVSELGLVIGQRAEAVLSTVAGHDAPAFVGPRSDATFDITVVGGSSAGRVTVTLANDRARDNRTIFDFVADVRAALTDAYLELLGDDFEGTDSIPIAVENDGGRLILKLKTDETGAPAGAAAGVTGFTVAISDASDPAVTDLKLRPIATPSPTSPVSLPAVQADMVIYTRDGGIHTVSLAPVLGQDNNLGNLIDAIESQTGSAVEAGINDSGTALLLRDTTSPSGDNPFHIEKVNGSPVAIQLGIWKVAETDTIQGDAIGLVDLSERFFLEQLSGFDHVFAADLRLVAPDGVEVSAGNFGFVGIEMTAQTGSPLLLITCPYVNDTCSPAGDVTIFSHLNHGEADLGSSCRSRGG
jgi:hypothetical protein